MVIVAVVKVVVVVVVVKVVGKFARPGAGMSAQPAACFAQGLEIEVVIWEFSQRGELGAARRERSNTLPQPDAGGGRAPAT